MTSCIYSVFIVLLTCLLVWPVFGQDEDDIWVNEVSTTFTLTHGLVAHVELVGRPKSTGADAPRQMKAQLTFYTSEGGDVIDTTAKDVVLLPGGSIWNGNYMGLMEAQGSVDAAFPDDPAVVGGVVLSVGGEEKRVYCWGATAGSGSATIGGGKACEGIVSEQSMNVGHVGHVRDAALYGGTGSKEGDYTWMDSTDAEDEEVDFQTLGFVNAHKDDGITDQAMDSWSFTDTTVVWLNEVDSENGAFIEIVGRPTTPPSNGEMVVGVQFYLGDETKGPAAEVTLVPQEDFAGNYALSAEVGDDAGDAFPSDPATNAGVVLTYSSLQVVYCWGSASTASDATLGAGIPCGRTVRTVEPFAGQQHNSALYNKDCPDSEGEREGDFVWSISADGATGFSTLGEINACKSDATSCTHHAQALRRGDVSPNDNMVWLNELDVVGHDTPAEVVASLELVGRPVASAESAKATVKFYDGSTASQVGADLEVVLTPQSTGGWNGNYMGSYVDTEKTYALAFLRTATIGGVSLTYGGETRVYCWGSAAKVGEAIDGSGASVKCETVVTVENMQGSEGQTNVAMWNKGGCDATPTGGGSKGDDFNWAMSIHSTSNVFGTIGEENLCPSGVTCSADVIDQVLAAWSVNNVVWLNELDVVAHESDAARSVASLEFVGRPVKTNEEPPKSISVTLMFYDGAQKIGNDREVSLARESGDWKENFVGSFVDSNADYGAAFPRSNDKSTGMSVVYDSVPRVYCWGEGAVIGKDIADGVTCQTVVTQHHLNSADSAHNNVALWNKDNTPDSGGSELDHFEWSLSLKGSTPFATIGDVNACETAGACGNLVDQVVALLDWEPSTSSSTSTSTTATSTAAAQKSVAAVGLAVVVVARVM